MTPLLLLRLVLPISFVIATAAPILAQGPEQQTATPLPANPVAEYTAELQKREDAVAAKLDAVSATVAAEVAAKRLKADVAEQERRQVANLRRQLGTLTDATIRSAPAEAGAAAQALTKAWGEFTEALRARQTFQTQAAPKLEQEVLRYAEALWRNASREEDFAPAIEVLRAAEAALPLDRPRGGFGSPLSGAAQLLTSSQQFLSALNSGVPRLIAEASQTLSNYGRGPGQPMVTVNDVHEWRKKFEDRQQADLDAALKEADALIARRAPSAELLATTEKVTGAAARVRALTSSLNASPGTRNVPEEPFLRQWARVVTAIEQKDWAGAQTATGGLNLPADWISPATRAVLTETQAEIQRQLRAAEKAQIAAREKEMQERLAKVTDAASAAALAEDLQAEQQTTPNRREEFGALVNDLRRLAALWNAEGRPNSFAEMHDGGAAHPWTASVRALRMRAVREQLARRLNAPELLKPPLDAMPPEAAVRQLGREFFEKKEWMRLHTLLSDSAPFMAGNPSVMQGDELRGVRALLAGQNFERAEQFAEAVQSYRSALICIGELVPVDAVAERLKALKGEHPEAFSASPAASRPLPRGFPEAADGF